MFCVWSLSELISEGILLCIASVISLRSLDSTTTSAPDDDVDDDDHESYLCSSKNNVKLLAAMYFKIPTSTFTPTNACEVYSLS